MSVKKCVAMACIFAAIAVVGVSIDRKPAALAEMSSSRTPVVVELFTSEGCSSCPPADKLLQSLVKNQPIGGAQVIALEEHVDYWNHLGWSDPFSSAQYSKRQNDYAAHFNSTDVYTPQMVVAGRYAFVGSDSDTATEKITTAANLIRRRQINPQVTVANNLASVRIPAGESGGSQDVFVAITEDNLFSNIKAGENQGRRLTHIATVREMKQIGTVAAKMPFTGQYTIPSGSGRRHLVVFVQDEKTHAIDGAAQIDLT